MKDKETIAFVEKELDKPFAWGTNDCNTIVLKYIDEVLGHDVLHKIYGKYRTKLGAIRFNRKQNYTFSDGIIEELGAVKLPPKMARTGDILVVSDEGYELCQICLGNQYLSVLENSSTITGKIYDFSFYDWALRIE